MRKKLFLRSLLSYAGILCIGILFTTQNIFSQSRIWVGTWSCAPYAAGSGNTPPSPYIANNTLRQVIRVSIGGDTLRVKFSNKTCATPVTMNSVKIAVSTGGSSIDVSTTKQLKFNGSSSVTMNPFSSTISDLVAFTLMPNMRIAITIYYGQAASNIDITSHYGSRTDSYILAGDQTSAADFSGATITPHWYTINTVDVRAPQTAGCVGVLGNSITDGYGLSGGLQNRWTDFFSQALLNNSSTLDVGVLNLGIGGSNVSGTGVTTGASRYQQDILNQSGLRWVIIFYGTNDLAAGASFTTITNAYKKMIADAHARNIKVYGATITPFYGHSHYTVAHDSIRNLVNNWIRTAGNFDASIDFDKIIRDPDDPIKLLKAYSNDWLHPSVAGYQLLGGSVDLNLFTQITNNNFPIANAGADQTIIDNENKGSQTITLDGSGSYDFGGEIPTYVWKEGNIVIATGVNPSVNLAVGTHTITLTVTDSDGNTVTDVVVVNVIMDSGAWLEAECGTVGSLWNVETDTTAANNKYLTIQPGNNSSGSAPGATGQLAYTFNVRESGTYYLWLRVMCPDINGDSFWLKMDNGSFSYWNEIIKSTAWAWAKAPSTYALTAGNHTLSIGYREDGAKLDKMWISKTNTSPMGVGSVAGNCISSGLPAESADNTCLYPNPVKDIVTLSMQDYTSQILLYNSNGQLLSNFNANDTHTEIKMGQFSPGIYVVKIVGLNQLVIKKIIKE